MNKKLIRLTESDLHRIVKESVKIIIDEWNGNWNGDRDLEPESFDDPDDNPYRDFDEDPLDHRDD